MREWERGNERGREEADSPNHLFVDELVLVLTSDVISNSYMWVGDGEGVVVVGVPAHSWNRIGYGLSKILETHLLQWRFPSCRWHKMWLTYPLGNIKTQYNICLWQVISLALYTLGSACKERHSLVSRGKRDQKATWRRWPQFSYFRM